MNERLLEKLAILADAAKYDVSCASSGSDRKNAKGGLGNATGMGICHAYTEDGRCVSLLKILLTNHCIFDCAYCVSRKSNPIQRAAFTVEEVVSLTVNFYRRNFIEGLFLSSGIFSSPDTTMERLVRIARLVRTQHQFNGYIHLKAIPGASDELMREAALYADRLSVNMEMPTRESLALVAPDKDRNDMIRPMRFLRDSISANREERAITRKAPLYAPAGQSTQMVIGATPESDLQILAMSHYFYNKMKLKRVYYSGYVPISDDNRLPAIGTPVPMVRENRLYQADWLMRFYDFRADELIHPEQPNLDLDIDPKLAWALRHLDKFPVNPNTADLSTLKRVPGIGRLSAKRIVEARQYGIIRAEDVKKMGAAWNKARHFLHFPGQLPVIDDLSPDQIKSLILHDGHSKYTANLTPQLSIF